MTLTPVLEGVPLNWLSLPNQERKQALERFSRNWYKLQSQIPYAWPKGDPPDLTPQLVDWDSRNQNAGNGQSGYASSVSVLPSEFPSTNHLSTTGQHVSRG